jgi:hypothetical protein
MTRTGHITFGPFSVDVESQRLTRDDEEVTLRPRAFAVLRHLLEHAARFGALGCRSRDPGEKCRLGPASSARMHQPKWSPVFRAAAATIARLRGEGRPEPQASSFRHSIVGPLGTPALEPSPQVGGIDTESLADVFE